MSDTIFLYMHDSKLEGGCGGVSFAYDHMPTESEEMLVEHTVPFNGCVPSPYEVVSCATCGGTFPDWYTFPLTNFIAYKS